MIFMAIMPKKQAEDSKKKRVTRKPRKTAVSAPSGTKRKKSTISRFVGKKAVAQRQAVKKNVPKESIAKKVVTSVADDPKPVIAIIAPKRKRAVRRHAMAEMQQRASRVKVVVGVDGGKGSSGAMRTLTSYGMILGALIGAVAIGAFVIRVTNAATFQGPTQVAPGGNIPVTIWNATSTGSLQENASIDIDGTITANGSLTVGATPLDLGSTAAGQNALYGAATYAGMHSGDNLLLLQTEALGTYTKRFGVDKDGNAYVRGELRRSAGSQVMDFTSANGNFRMTQQDGGGRFHMGWNVNGNGLYNGTYRISGEPSLWMRWSTNGFTWQAAPGGTAGTAIPWSPILHADVNGYVGVGKTGPGYPLDVASSSGTALLSLDDTNTLASLYTGMRLARDGTETWFIGMTDTDDDFHIRAGGADPDVVTISKSGDVSAAGAITAEGCFGASFVGVTTSGGTGAPLGTGVYKVGDILSYYGINNKCGSDYPDSHACTVNEMLESIRCSEGGSPIRTNGGEIAWINGGPPGFTANSNDCIGWTDSTASAYGRYWSFDNVTGGFGTMTTCNAPGLKVACCS